MDGVVTLLSAEQNERMRGVWAALRENCGLKGIEVTPIPHFSWHTAEEYDLELASNVLANYASEADSFEVVTGGFGLFMNPEPVLYLAVAKNRPLLDLHEELWSIISPLGTKVNRHYAPTRWMPHITLAQWGLTTERLACALSLLKDLHLELTVEVNNLAIICQTNRQVGALRAEFSFGPRSNP